MECKARLYLLCFHQGKSGEVHMLELMLKQLFDVLNECVAQPTEVISRLGCSCIRYMLSLCCMINTFMYSFFL